MLKKPITYTDFDGNEITEDFYFNLSKSELVEMELTQPGLFTERMKEIIANGDGAVIIPTFKNIISNAVGRRSEDGKRFIKSKEISDEFMQSLAYDELFLGLVTNAGEAAEFISGIMPRDVVEKAKARLAEDVQLPELPQEGTPVKATPEEHVVDLSPKALSGMTDEEFDKVWQSVPRKNVPKSVLAEAMRRANNK